MSDSDWPVSEDPIKQAIDRANALIVAKVIDQARADALLDDVAALHPRDLLRFDERSRGYLSGIAWHRVPALRGEAIDDARGRVIPWRRTRAAEPTEASLRLWQVLAAVSGDGRERQRAVEQMPSSALGARLLAIRCVDWVPQVRDAALDRLDQWPSATLAESLPLLAQLAAERSRGQLLDALIDARLTDTDLRSMCTHDDVLARRVAWKRLSSRDVLGHEELCRVAAGDHDIVVRAVAANALPSLAETERRVLAEVLVTDRVGWIAAIALGALVELDGPAAIVPALTAPTAALRRAARDWARVRDVDARDVYLSRLQAAPNEALALVALAEMGDERDKEVFDRMLTDERARVRAAGLRGLARIDGPSARRAALDALDRGQSGRVAWAAAAILRDGVPSSAESEVLSRVALDPDRAVGQRFRALALIRPARWLHLVTMLEMHEAAESNEIRARLRGELDSWNGSRLTRAPDAVIRARIEQLLPVLDTEKRGWVEFVLRTSS